MTLWRAVFSQVSNINKFLYNRLLIPNFHNKLVNLNMELFNRPLRIHRTGFHLYYYICNCKIMIMIEENIPTYYINFFVSSIFVSFSIDIDLASASRFNIF